MSRWRLTGPFTRNTSSSLRSRADDEHRLELLRRGVGELEAHRVAAAPLAQLVADRLEEVVGLLLVDVEVAVARDAELGHAGDLEAREEPVEEVPHELAQEHEGGRSDPLTGTSRGSTRGIVTTARRLTGSPGPPDQAGDAEELVLDPRERVRGVDRERRQHRPQALVDVRPELIAVLGPDRIVGADDQAGAASAGRSSSFQTRYCSATNSRAALADAAQEVARADAVRPDGVDVLGRRLADARDPDLEELVEVAGGDRQELDALEERIRGVPGLFEHPAVEVEPGELAIRERFWSEWDILGMPSRESRIFESNAAASARRACGDDPVEIRLPEEAFRLVELDPAAVPDAVFEPVDVMAESEQVEDDRLRLRARRSRAGRSSGRALRPPRRSREPR